MSLRVRSLNADTSFLLVFSPPHAPPHHHGSCPGSFSILVDPWLTGPSVTWMSKFAQSVHTVDPAVLSLAHLPEPDVVLISQDKDDHCNRNTLTQLPASTRAKIVGTAAAVKRIRSWRHFDLTSLHALPRYHSDRPDTVLRIPIPAPSGYAYPGEVTIALMAPKVDVTGLHNALGITYRPPIAFGASSPLTTLIDLPLTPPASPITTPQQPLSSLSFLAHSNTSLNRLHRPISPPSTATPLFDSTSSTHSLASTTGTLHTSPLSKTALDPSRTANTLSVIYSPHGLDYDPFISNYASTHLLLNHALPLTALLHSFDTITNPWYLGGTVCNGSRGSGLAIARSLAPRAWISAHDEEKICSGLATRQIRTEKCDMDKVVELLGQQSISAKDDARLTPPSSTPPSSRGASTSSTSLNRSRSRSELLTTAVVSLDAGGDHYIAAC